MKAEFVEIRPFVYNFKLMNMPFTSDQFRAEVALYDAKLLSASVCGNRHMQHKNFGPIFSYLKTFFTSKEFQNQLITTISQNPDFFNKHWKTEIIRFSTIIHPFFGINIDSPGFKMGIHLDNRKLVVVGMCHFIDDDDPDQCTTFYTTELGDDPVRIPTGFGCGWTSANLHNTWHSGQNLSDKPRISVHFGLTLALP